MKFRGRERIRRKGEARDSGVRHRVIFGDDTLGCVMGKRRRGKGILLLGGLEWSGKGEAGLKAFFTPLKKGVTYNSEEKSDSLSDDLGEHYCEKALIVENGPGKVKSLRSGKEITIQ